MRARLIGFIPLLIVLLLAMPLSVGMAPPVSAAVLGSQNSLMRGSAGQFGLSSPPNAIPDQYLVFFRDSVTDPQQAANDMAQRYGLSLIDVYDALNGFAAVISPQSLSQVITDSRVLEVDPNLLGGIISTALPASSIGTPVPRTQQTLTEEQQASTGLQRIGGSSDGIHQTLTNKGTGVGVAVLDTGIDLSHPDLSPVQDGKTCIPGTKTAQDDQGHGTHVAGIIAARDNSIGVVGVAPQATLYAVKVLDSTGHGTTAQVLCGIDWVTRHASAIQVANMSLGFVVGFTPSPSSANCTNSDHDALHRAICKSVMAGVTYVVAAGNQNTDASHTLPAAYSEVITVSALADNDGQPGALGGSFSCPTYQPLQDDDHFATFSNFGSSVAIAGPGACILSTVPIGSCTLCTSTGYNLLSGTSQATPFVAGAAVLYKQRSPSATPAQVKAYLRATAEPCLIPGDPGSERLVNLSSWNVVARTSQGKSNGLIGVSALSDTDIWAVGVYNDTSNNELTLTEHWNGAVWSVMPSPNPGPSSNELLGVAAISSNDVWAVGSYRNGATDQTLTEHWNGVTWTVIPSPEVGLSDNYLVGVTAVSSNDVWAVGQEFSVTSVYQTLIEHWNGVVWSVVPSPNVGPNSNVLEGVTATSATDVWAVGESNDNMQTLTEHWDGANWSVIPSPNTGASYNYLHAVTAISTDDVWAVGDGQSSASIQTLIEHWDGMNWSIVSSPNIAIAGSTGFPQNFLKAVEAVSATDVWAVGYCDCGGSGTLVEHWNGTSWRVIPTGSIPGSPENTFNGVTIVSASNVWAVGDSSGEALIEDHIGS